MAKSFLGGFEECNDVTNINQGILVRHWSEHNNLCSLQQHKIGFQPRLLAHISKKIIGFDECRLVHVCLLKLDLPKAPIRV